MCSSIPGAPSIRSTRTEELADCGEPACRDRGEYSIRHEAVERRPPDVLHRGAWPARRSAARGGARDRGGRRGSGDRRVRRAGAGGGDAGRRGGARSGGGGGAGGGGAVRAGGAARGRTGSQPIRRSSRWGRCDERSAARCRAARRDARRGEFAGFAGEVASRRENQPPVCRPAGGVPGARDARVRVAARGFDPGVPGAGDVCDRRGGLGGAARGAAGVCARGPDRGAGADRAGGGLGCGGDRDARDAGGRWLPARW